jgi:hypothetical protein
MRAMSYQENLQKRRGGAAPEPLEVRVQKRAAELMKADQTLSRAAAEVEVYKRHPELYVEHCAATDLLPPGYGRGPTDAEYDGAFTKSGDYELSESSQLKLELDQLIEAELRRLSAERATARGTKAAPAATREEAMARVLLTAEGRRLRDQWLEALNAERAASERAA